jgi:hypothetical protein
MFAGYYKPTVYKMPSIGICLEEVLAHNKSLKKDPKGLVGVFGKFVEKSRRTTVTEVAQSWRYKRDRRMDFSSFHQKHKLSSRLLDRTKSPSRRDNNL